MNRVNFKFYFTNYNWQFIQVKNKKVKNIYNKGKNEASNCNNFSYNKINLD